MADPLNHKFDNIEVNSSDSISNCGCALQLSFYLFFYSVQLLVAGFVDWVSGIRVTQEGKWQLANANIAGGLSEMLLIRNYMLVYSFILIF